MGQADTVYHFTDTIRLPWILASGELRPSRNVVARWPMALLWATSNPVGDRTSNINSEWSLKAYRQGVSQMVRFTLRGSDFLSWQEIQNQFPVWTATDVYRIESSARERGETGIDKWYGRVDGLPLDAVVEVHAKTYTGGRWVLVRGTSVFTPPDQRERRCVIINGDQTYCSTQLRQLLDDMTGYIDIARCGVIG